MTVVSSKTPTPLANNSCIKPGLHDWSKHWRANGEELGSMIQQGGVTLGGRDTPGGQSATNTAALIKNGDT
jgi:hypothetical protein